MKKILFISITILLIISCSKGGNDSENDLENKKISFELIEDWAKNAAYTKAFYSSCAGTPHNQFHRYKPESHFNVNKLIFDFDNVRLGEDGIMFSLKGMYNYIDPSDGNEQYIKRPIKVKYIEVKNYRPNKKLQISIADWEGYWSQERFVNHFTSSLKEYTGPIIFYDSNVDFMKFLEDNLVDRHCNSFSKEDINKIFKKENFDAKEFKRTEVSGDEEIFETVLRVDSSDNIQRMGNVEAKDLKIGDVVLLGVDMDRGNGWTSLNAYRAWYKILTITRYHFKKEK